MYLLLSELSFPFASEPPFLRLSWVQEFHLLFLQHHFVSSQLRYASGSR